MTFTLLKFKTLVVLFIISISTFANTKHTVSGTISDATTGESLIGAGVIIKEIPGTGVSTNAYGYFSLTLPAGKYTLTVSYIGYKQFTQQIDLSANKMLQIKLEPNSQQLDEIEITAVRKNNNITSTEMGVERLEMKEISKIPVLFGEADIMKTLKLTPGIKSVGEGSGGLYVRGGSNSQNLILLDEATVYNAYGHKNPFSIDFEQDADDPTKTNAVMTYLFTFVPSITYNFRF